MAQARASNISSSFRTTANISAGNAGKLVVEISYTDALGIRRTIQKNVILNAAVAAGNFSGMKNAQQRGATQTRILDNNGGLTYIIIGAVGIIAIVAFFRIRKRKREKK